MHSNKNVGLSSANLLIAASPFLLAISRNITTPVLALLVVLLAIIVFGSREKAFSRKETLNLCSVGTMALFCGILGYMLASALWSPASDRAVASAVHMIGNAALFGLALASLKSMQKPPRFDWRIFFGFLAAAAVLIIEETAFGSPVRAFLGGSTDPFRLNRAAVAAVLYLPFCFMLLPGGPLGWAARTVGAALAVAMVLVCDSETAKLALLVTLVSLPVFWIGGRRLLWPLAVAVIASFILMPVLSVWLLDLLPASMSNEANYGSVGIRAEIWAAFSSLLPNAFIMGHGIEASYLAADLYKQAGVPNGLLGWGHPHNFAIQVWYELGAIGVALVSLLIIAYFRALRHMPDRYLPSILSTTSAVWTVCMVSHGAWQAWWWSLIGIIAIMWMLLLRSDQETQNVAD